MANFHQCTAYIHSITRPVLTLGMTAASTPFQALIFAKLISLFSLWGYSLSALTNYWCVIFAYLAVAAGLSHLVLVWATTSVGFVSILFLRILLEHCQICMSYRYGTIASLRKPLPVADSQLL